MADHAPIPNMKGARKTGRIFTRQENNMKKYVLFWCLNLFFLSVSFAGEHSLKLIGHYTNMLTLGGEDSHLSGYTVSLYQKKDATLFGQLSYAPGSIEAFGGVLYDIELNEKKHVLKFKVKLSSGVEINSVSGSLMNQREIRYLFIFDGRIFPHAIEGKLERNDGYKSNAKAEVNWVKLKRNQSRSSGFYIPESYEKWKQYAPAADW